MKRLLNLHHHKIPNAIEVTESGDICNELFVFPDTHPSTGVGKTGFTESEEIALYYIMVSL